MDKYNLDMLVAVVIPAISFVHGGSGFRYGVFTALQLHFIPRHGVFTAPWRRYADLQLSWSIIGDTLRCGIFLLLGTIN